MAAERATHRERLESLENTVATSTQKSQERMARLEAMIQQLSTTVGTLQETVQENMQRGDRQGRRPHREVRRERQRRESTEGSRISRGSVGNRERARHGPRVSSSSHDSSSPSLGSAVGEGHERPRGDRREARRERRDRRRERRRGDHERNMERPRLEFPKFSDGDPTSWLNRVEQFFEHNPMDDDEKVEYAGYYLEEDANEWWQWLRQTYSHERKEITWRRFKRELLRQFGPSPLVNHHAALTKLVQHGSLKDYQKEFQRLMAKVRDWPDKVLIGCFIGGLKPEIANEVNYYKPKTLTHAMELARVKDEQLARERRSRMLPSRGMAGPFYSKPMQRRNMSRPMGFNSGGSGARPSAWPRQGGVGPNASGVRRLSWEEMEARRVKGLCFKCNEKFVPGHRCKNPQVLMIDPAGSNGDDDDIEDGEAEGGVEDEEAIHEEVHDEVA